MRAIVVKAPGGPWDMEVHEVANPVPGEDELLITVMACGINRADIVQRKGLYPPPAGTSDILGLEVSGIVEAIGENVEGWVPGDQVFALLSGGGYAEKVVVRADQALQLPDYLTFVEGAAIPEAFLTAYRNLFDVGRLKPQESVLIHSGGSGVGTAAIQLAKKKGSRVMTTAGSQEKVERCYRLGADLAINYKEGSFVSQVLEATQGRGVDMIFDLVGASHWAQNQDVLAKGGRLLIIGVSGGTEIKADLRQIMRNNWQIFGSTLRTQSLDYKADLIRRFWNDCEEAFQSQELYPVMDCTFRLEEVTDAHQYLETNRNIGKVVLQFGKKK